MNSTHTPHPFQFRTLPLAILLLSGGLAACTETVESTDVRTSGIYPEFSVTADGSGSTVASARFKVGGNDSNTFLDLQGGDRVDVTVGDETKRLDSRGDHRYEATFSVDDPSLEFVFAFMREEQDESAPRSVVSLPIPFTLEMTTTEASRGADAVAFAWDSTTTGEVRWEVDGDCIRGDSGATPDDGEHSLGSDDVRAKLNDEMETCTVRLGLERRSQGTIDPAFTEGGENFGHQERVRSFTSTP